MVVIGGIFLEKEITKFKKINSKKLNSSVKAQGCDDDCVEYNVWVGKTDGNVRGCVIYSEVYTPRTTTWW